MIEEDERRGSSSGSSTCMVGTTTQGLESTTPQRGKQPYLNMARTQMPCPQCVKKKSHFKRGFMVYFGGFPAFLLESLTAKRQMGNIGGVVACNSPTGIEPVGL